ARAGRDLVCACQLLSIDDPSLVCWRDATHCLRRFPSSLAPVARFGATAVLIARAPLRISLAGAGTDFEPYYSKYGGAVVSATIDKFSYALLSVTDSPSVQVATSDYEGLWQLDFPKPGHDAHLAPFVLDQLGIL